MVVVVVSRILSAPLVAAKEHPSSASSPSMPSRRCGPLTGVLFDLYDAGGAVQGIATIPEIVSGPATGIRTGGCRRGLTDRGCECVESLRKLARAAERDVVTPVDFVGGDPESLAGVLSCPGGREHSIVTTE
jgi:hypothetical protein